MRDYMYIVTSDGHVPYVSSIMYHLARHVVQLDTLCVINSNYRLG